jgi:hypothetical protein
MQGRARSRAFRAMPIVAVAAAMLPLASQAEERPVEVILTSSAPNPTLEYRQAGVLKRESLTNGRWSKMILSNFTKDDERLFRVQLGLEPGLQISVGLRVQARKAPVELDVSTKRLSCNNQSLNDIKAMFGGASSNQQKTTAILTLLRLERVCTGNTHAAFRVAMAGILTDAYCAYSAKSADLIVLDEYRDYIRIEYAGGLGRFERCARDTKVNYARAAWREANDVILAAPTEERALYQKEFAIDLAGSAGWKDIFAELATNDTDYRAFKANVDYSLMTEAVRTDADPGLLSGDERQTVIANYASVADLADPGKPLSDQDKLVLQRSRLDVKDVIAVKQLQRNMDGGF